MFSRRSLLLTLTLLLVLTLPLGACKPGATEAPGEPTEVVPTEAPPEATTAATEVPPTEEPVVERPMISIRLRDMDMQQVDPAFIGRAGDDWIANNIYMKLVRWKIGTAEIEPHLATRWEYSEDGKEITFYLREGVMFHKGYGEVTAEDVKFSFDRIIDPETGSPFNAMLSIIEKVEVLDKYTVKLTLTAPSATLMSSILPFRPGYIVSKKAVEEMGQEQFSLNPVGSGPFVFDHWTTGVEVVLLANDDYYEGPPQIAGVRMLPIVEEDAAVIALQAGDISFAWLSQSESYLILKDDPSVAFFENRSTASRYMWFDTRKAPMDDPLVRQALWHATDRESISTYGFDGIHPPMDTIFMPTFLCYTTDIPTYEYNPEKARELLEQAGYPDGFTLTLLYSQRQISQTIAEMVQDQWKDINVNLEITGLEHGTYTSIRKDPEQRGDYDLIQTHFGRTADPDSFLIETLHGGAFPPGSNASYYDKLDDLIDAARVEVDPEARCEMYYQIQEQLQLDAPAIPIINTTYIFALDESLKGFIPGANLEVWLYPLYVEE